MVTLLPEHLPLAATTSSCAAPITISPASSLLVYGGGVLSEDQLKFRLGIDAGIVIRQFDAFQASVCRGTRVPMAGAVPQLSPSVAGLQLSDNFFTFFHHVLPCRARCMVMPLP
jgi:hypothetical protein